MKKPQILIVNGVPGSGKDTMAELLNKYAVVEKLSIIDLAKDIAMLSGWDGVKGDRSRQFLCDIKDLVDEFSDASHIYIDKRVNSILKTRDCDYILIDAREGKDISRLVERFGAMSVKVTNKNVTTRIPTRADQAAVGDCVEYDIVLANDGTLDDFEKTIEVLHGQLRNM